MNYIKHLTGFFEKVSTDFDLNPTHISLYMAVFQLWNQNRFYNPISVSRDELMRISKIASTATYHKCMKELTEKGYVKYKPSFNPFKGSTLDVINLDFYTKPIQKKEIKKIKSQQKNEQVIEQVTEQVTEQLINKQQTSAEHVPYINNTNNLNIVNEQAQKNQNQNQNFHPELASTELSQSIEEFNNESSVTSSAVEKLISKKSKPILASTELSQSIEEFDNESSVTSSAVEKLISKKSKPTLASTELSQSIEEFNNESSVTSSAVEKLISKKSKPTLASTELSQSIVEFDNQSSVTSRAVEKLISKKSKPTFEETQSYFLEKNVPEIEAQRFFNYFQSNGWLVGGKSPMKDWKAAARNWILNADKFNNKNRHPELAQGPKPNHLHTSNYKNYGEPL